MIYERFDEQFCGQCDARQVDMVCDQCQEFFCASCAASIHRRGQMAKHNLRATKGQHLSSALEDSMSSELKISLNEACKPGPDGGSTTLYCCFHVAEPARFFCFTCECECICAVCVVNGLHAGHRVIGTQVAAKQLPAKFFELSRASGHRGEVLQEHKKYISENARLMADLCDDGRSALRSEFGTIRQRLFDMEAALIADLDSCATEAKGSYINAADRARFATLKDFLRASNDLPSALDAVVINELNLYAKSSALMATEAGEVQHPCDIVRRLKLELAYGFEIRFSKINAINADIDLLGGAESTS